jgi:hypothetical protein
MLGLCLPKELSVKLKVAIRDTGMTIEKLYNMTSKQRREFFTKYVGDEAGRFVNAGFEKSIASTQKDALEKWVEKTFRGKKPKKKSLLDKINSIEEYIDPEGDIILEDLVADKLGVSVTAEEVAKIKELAEKVQETEDKLNGWVGLKFGDNAHNQNLLEYFSAHNKVDEYVASLNPQPKGKILLSTVGRGNMLMSPKTIALNIESNTVVGGTEFLIRRMESGRLSGANHKAMAEYIKWVNKIFDKTGKDITRMIDQTSGAFQGEKVSSAAGPGFIRKLGRFYENTIYKVGLGKPDVLAASFAFADSANLASTSIAKKQGYHKDVLESKALEFFQDATSPNPVTTEGMMIREQAMKDAFESTYTNEGMLSTFVLKSLREPLNKVYSGLGEFVIPFAKTPANVVEITADYGGLGAVKGLAKLARFFKTGDTSLLRSATKDALRTGTGIILAYLLVAWLDPDDYIGEYPISSKEKALLAAKNATPNSIKVGEKYYSLDYLGPLGGPVVGLLRARKYGREKNYAIKAKEYATGIIQQFLRTPGIREIKDLTVTGYKAISQPFSRDFSQMSKDLANDLINAVPPRLLPAIITDFAKMTDTTQRKPDYAKPLTRLQAKVPFWGQELPPRITVFGEEKKNEAWWSQLLFGARVKTAIDTPLVKELTYLERAGQLPAIGNPEYTSRRFKSLKEQIGNVRFTQAMKLYGQLLKSKMDNTIRSNYYKKGTDIEKKAKLDKIKRDTMDTVLLRFRYRKPKSTK